MSGRHFCPGEACCRFILFCGSVYDMVPSRDLWLSILCLARHGSKPWSQGVAFGRGTSLIERSVCRWTAPRTSYVVEIFDSSGVYVCCGHGRRLAFGGYSFSYIL